MVLAQPTQWMFDCDDAAAEQIRTAVTEGFRALGHGGLEVGGVLFGRISAEGVHVETSRPLLSNHAYGPAMRLSTQDQAALIDLLNSGSGHPGQLAVGWYRSCTRSSLEVSEHDQDVIRRFFPRLGSVLLLLRSAEGRQVFGRIYVRGESGELLSNSDTKEIDFSISTHPPLERPQPKIPPPEPPAFAKTEVSKSRWSLPGKTSAVVILFVAFALAIAFYLSRPSSVSSSPNAESAIASQQSEQLDARDQEIAELRRQIILLNARNQRLESALSLLLKKAGPQDSGEKGTPPL